MKVKTSLIWLGSVIGAGAFMALVFGALTGPRDIKTISVNGECITTAPKDKTAITLRVSALEPTAVASMQSATTQMAEITKYLESQPVEMQTTQFNSYEKTEWNRDEQKSVTLGIETTIAIEVSANNIQTIEQILSQFAGRNNVYTENLRMYTSPEVLKPIMENCLSVAVENARTRADALASGDGKHAGKMLSVSYGTGTHNSEYPVPKLMRSNMILAESAADASGTIVAKDTDVSVSVSAVFEIK